MLTTGALWFTIIGMLLPPDVDERIFEALKRATNPLRCVCAWCQREIRPGIPPTTHGICARCATSLFTDRKDRYDESDCDHRSA